MSSNVRAPEPPTLLTTMSRPPNCSTAAATTARAPSRVETSAATPAARPGPSIVADRRLQPLGVARAEHDVGSLGGERGGDPEADPAARARHDRDLAGEPEIHRAILRARHVPARVHAPRGSSSQTTCAFPGSSPSSRTIVPATAERTRATVSGGRPSKALMRTSGGCVAAGCSDGGSSSALAIAARLERLPRHPRSGRILAELRRDREHERPGDGVEVDADPLAERGDLHDRHRLTLSRDRRRRRVR